MTSIEDQLDYQIYKRWSLDIFTGYGIAYNSFKNLDSGIDVINYGNGFRYLLANKFGLRTGMNFRFSNDNDFAFSFVIGSTW